jgi:hypothetical protein
MADFGRLLPEDFFGGIRGFLAVCASWDGWTLGPIDDETTIGINNHWNNLGQMGRR